MKFLWLLITSWIGLTACVTDAHDNAGDAGVMNQDASKPIIPWAVGNQWTYRVTGGGGVTTKVTSIGAEETIGGEGPHSAEMAYKVTTLKQDGTDQSLSWQAPLDGKVVRYREQSFSATSNALTLDEHWEPYKLHIDGTALHSVPDATWFEDYMETKLPVAGASSTQAEHDRWAVDQADASVSVPAGTFQHAIVFTKAGGSDLKTYWYVRGIGKIKETGGQTEELVDYQVQSAP
jgi:hypothetical protein